MFVVFNFRQNIHLIHFAEKQLIVLPASIPLTSCIIIYSLTTKWTYEHSITVNIFVPNTRHPQWWHCCPQWWHRFHYIYKTHRTEWCMVQHTHSLLHTYIDVSNPLMPARTNPFTGAMQFTTELLLLMTVIITVIIIIMIIILIMITTIIIMII